MSEVLPNPQAERVFARFGLEYRLVEEFPIESIQNVDGQQVRFAANIANHQVVEEYFQQYKAGATFPPVVLAEPGTIIDGNTRLAMARKAQLKTFPAYLVTVSSLDLAKALGAYLNNTGGVRLTQDESYQAAVDMMGENLNFTDSQIAEATGKSATQVRNWRIEREAGRHATRTNTSETLALVPSTQHKLLGKIVQDAPFKAAVELAGSRRLSNATVKTMVDDIAAAPSETEALETIAAVARDNPSGGPGGVAVVRNTKAARMRMVLPQVINLRPPEELYEAEKAAEDEKLWREVRRVAEAQVAYYEQMTPAQSSFVSS